MTLGNKESVKMIGRVTATRSLGLWDRYTSISWLEQKSGLLLLSSLLKFQYPIKPTEYKKGQRSIDGPEDIEVTIHDRGAVLCVPIEKWHCQKSLLIISEFGTRCAKLNRLTATKVLGTNRVVSITMILLIINVSADI